MNRQLGEQCLLDARCEESFLHDSTAPEVIAATQREVVTEAVREFRTLFPDLALIPHALTHLCDLPLWTVRRRLHELGLGPNPVKWCSGVYVPRNDRRPAPE